MGLGVDWGVGCRVKVKVEPIFGEVKYKKGSNLCPLKYNLQHLNQVHHGSDLNRSLPADNIIQHIAIGAIYCHLKGVVLNVTIKTRVFRSCYN